MKNKNLFLTFALIGSCTLHIDAQTPSIPNGNFESWTAITSEIPQNYVWSSNLDAIKNGMPFNVTKSTDAYHGNYAVQMTTEISNGDTLPGIFVSANPKSNSPANWHGGFAYNQTPSGMSGYYKSDIATPDTGFVIAFFYKGGTMIGQYGFYFYGTHNTYTPFSFNFNPALTQSPDTVIFGAGSSNFSNQHNMRNGSMLLLDYISFTGVSSQPALFNGDFETWQSTIIDKPDGWFFQRGSNDNVNGGAYKTNDAKAGNYALELTTYVGERNNNTVAQSGQISTGWYPNNCSNNCQEQGGYPFTNHADTLAFWYKYAPVGNTTASINLNFKKNGNNYSNTGTTLFASPNYQYVEIPFDIIQNPDSVAINIQSSQWQDSLLSFVGSDLKIDEMHFKSQSLTGIFTYKNQLAINIYPNPACEKVIVSFSESTGEQIDLNIFNAIGEQVFTQQISDNTGVLKIDVSKLPEGIYFIHMTSRNQSYYDKKIIINR